MIRRPAPRRSCAIRATGSVFRQGYHLRAAFAPWQEVRMMLVRPEQDQSTLPRVIALIGPEQAHQL
jgi:hypothetical protein